MVNREALLNALEYFQNLTHEEVEYLKKLVQEDAAREQIHNSHCIVGRKGSERHG